MSQLQHNFEHRSTFRYDLILLQHHSGSLSEKNFAYPNFTFKESIVICSKEMTIEWKKIQILNQTNYSFNYKSKLLIRTLRPDIFQTDLINTFVSLESNISQRGFASTGSMDKNLRRDMFFQNIINAHWFKRKSLDTSPNSVHTTWTIRTTHDLPRYPKKLDLACRDAFT